MNFVRVSFSLPAVLLALTLASCGGHHHDDSASTPTTPTTPSQPEQSLTAVTVHVIDDDIQGATVFIDENNDNQLNANETRAVTDKNGDATLMVTQAQMVAHNVVQAIVGTGAVDAALGAVTTPYALTSTLAEGETKILVSPFTTLVQNEMERLGVSQPVARATIDRNLAYYGAVIDTLADYTLSATESNLLAAKVAKVIVLIQQDLMKSVGDNPMAMDVVNEKMIEVLQQIVTLAKSPAVVSAPDEKSRNSQLAFGALGIAVGVGISPNNIAGIIEAYRASPTIPTPGSGLPTRTLRFLQYAGRGFYYDVAIFSATAEQNTVTNNLLHFAENRRLVLPTVVSNESGLQWSTMTRTWGQDYRRDTNVWTGSEWFACPENFVQEQTVPNNDLPSPGQTVNPALGQYQVTYCNAYKYTLKPWIKQNLAGSTFKLVHENIASIIAARLADPATVVAPEPIVWEDEVIPDEAFFDAGAELEIPMRDEPNPPFSHSTVDRPSVYETEGSACLFGGSHLAVSLEDLLTLKGVPCPANPNQTSGAALLTLTVGNQDRVDDPIAVSFSSNPLSKEVIYWRCRDFVSCVQIGPGTYDIVAINTAGDRAMVFDGSRANQPLEVANRIFVQRGAKVFYGTRNKPSTGQTVIRLNTIATDNLLSRLQIPPL